jgi:NADPH:quinone reductase
MRVIQARRFGGPEVLTLVEAPEPVAERGQVLVAVEVAAIDFVQTQLRRGFTPGPPLPDLPYVPGGTVAGRVRSAGAGVDQGWLGRRVVTRTASGWGGNAELAVAEADALVEVPADVGLDVAAALLDDGSTALGLVDGVGIQPGEWVLVEAAAGGLGSLLVQLAVAAGGRVIGAAGGARKLDLAKQLGAEAVVDYGEPGWAELARAATGGRGPDVVFDGVGGQLGRDAFAVTAPGGRFSVHGASSGAATVIEPAEADRQGVRVLELSQLFALQRGVRERAGRALAEAAAGRLRPVIGQARPLAEAADAHAAMEARTVLGKSLLLI